MSLSNRAKSPMITELITVRSGLWRSTRFARTTDASSLGICSYTPLGKLASKDSVVAPLLGFKNKVSFSLVPRSKENNFYAI